MRVIGWTDSLRSPPASSRPRTSTRTRPSPSARSRSSRARLLTSTSSSPRSGTAAVDPPLPPEGTSRAVRSRCSRVGRRSRLRPRLAHPPDRPACRRRPASRSNELFSRVMTRRMDRDRPLWEYWFCEGLDGGRWALLSKIHHSMVDGVSGSDLYRLVLDPSPVPREPVPDDWAPATPCSGLSFTTSALLELAILTGRRSSRVPLPALASPAPARPHHRRVGPGRVEARLRGSAGARDLLDGTAGRKPPLRLGERLADRHPRRPRGSRRHRQRRRPGRRRRRLPAPARVTRGDPDPHALRSLVPVSMRAPGEESVPTTGSP